jgi:hypothetical protein
MKNLRWAEWLCWLGIVAAFTFCTIGAAFADTNLPPTCNPTLADGQSFGLKVTLQPTNFQFYPVVANPIDAASSTAAWWQLGAGAYYLTSFWCRTKYSWQGKFYVGDRSKLSDPARLAVMLTKVGSASVAAIADAHSTYGNEPLSPEMKAVGFAQLNAVQPPEVPWIVAKNGTSADRPMYPVTNGVRGTTAIKGSRATVGASCACYALAIEEGKNSYCAIKGQSVTDLNAVALCVSQ